MTLKQYLQSKRMTQTAFAELVNLPAPTINRYVKGSRFPERDIILRIQDATGGKVKPADWFVGQETAA